MKLSIVLVAASLAFSSCNCFKKMAQNRDEVNLTVNPEILTLNNGIVAADINVTFPAEYFNKKAVIKVTPVIVFEGGEVAGTPKYYQGSKVDDNYTVVDNTDGGSFTQHVEFPYDPRMDQCALQLRAEIKCPSGACKEFTLVNLNDGALPTKEQAEVLAGDDAAAKAAIAEEFGLTVAYGLNTLQKDLKYGDIMEPMASNYKRVITVVDKTDLLYAINSSVVTKKNERKADLGDFKDNVDKNLQNDRATQNIAVKGYASPDGPEKFNDKLSKARSESGKKVVAKLLKKTGLDVDAAAYGEDWEGFKELVEKSDIKDKNLILQVLSLYNSPAQRESEIKNMSSVFDELKSDILPELRRSQIVNSTDIQGKTDAEIMAAYRNGDRLTAEEYLYAAETLANGAAEQVAILSAAARKYNDARIYNNLGIAQTKAGQKAEALKSFEKAAKLDSSKDLNKNLLLANLANGNTAEAKKYAQSADAEAKAAMAAAQGDYKAAANTLEGYNAAVACVMNNDLPAAKKAIAKDNSADADYLRAVIAAKEGDLNTANAQLKSAVSKNPALAEKAAKDVNLKALR
ncbi:MAG: tetratricopeptide repeat protein [Alistipes sp.]|nr:tetratricopeptide repeat protein [Alistipes senegalensis]MCM1250651.1 tetratricopeptide repeat protein [Alistipes sp.]